MKLIKQDSTHNHYEHGNLIITENKANGRCILWTPRNIQRDGQIVGRFPNEFESMTKLEAQLWRFEAREGDAAAQG